MDAGGERRALVSGADRKVWSSVAYEGAHAVGRMSASEPFDGTRDQGGDNYYVENY